MTALEAAIHFAIWHFVGMDGRVEPGHDEKRFEIQVPGRNNRSIRTLAGLLD
jgi:hypothetical protein